MKVNIAKKAAEDANSWAVAEMFFGPGAGTRRKLLNAQIIDKAESVDGYFDAFEEAYAKIDWTKAADQATKQRKAIDRGDMIKRNTRGILTGNRKNLSTTVLVAGVAYFYARETGLDKEIKAEAQKRYRQTKVWIERKRRDYKGTQTKGM